MPSRKIKRFSYKIDDTFIEDMSFLCDLRTYIEVSIDRETLIDTYQLGKFIDEIEKLLAHRLGMDFFYKRMDYENHKKVQAQTQLRKK
jgi:hypothetical protein